MVAAAALALLAGCDAPPAPGDGGGGSAGATLALVRMARWPGAGVELTVRVDGAAVADLAGAVRVEAQGGGEAPRAAARPVALAPGYTLVLVAPIQDSAARDAAALALVDLVESRPAGERIAIYRTSTSSRVDQVVGFTRDRARLTGAASLALAAPAADAPAPDAPAVLAAADEVARIGGVGPRAMRALVVVGADVPDEARAATAVPLLDATGAADELRSSALAASRAIDRLAGETHLAIATCPGAGATSGSLAIDGVDGELDLTWPEPWPEAASAPCDPDEMLAAPQPVPPRLDLLFSPEERAVYDERIASLSVEEFALSIRLAPYDDAIAATAHLRGQTSLFCDRKSYTIHLAGPARHLWPDSYADQAYLIAMCADEYYLQLYTSYQLLAALDLYPVKFRYVELTLDGAERGVYLLVEKVDDALVRTSARSSAVLRRRFVSGDEWVEVEKARGDDGEAALAAWTDMQSGLAGLAGSDLEAALRAHLDLDRFLTWLALMTALESGDYVDEIWLTATDALEPDGSPGRYWTFAGWDQDDLFAACHYAGAFAFPDPNGLATCAEGTLDRLLLDDPVLYRRYVDALARTLADLPPDELQRALDRTAADLLPWFERPEICAAMTELLAVNPGAADPAEAQRDIREHIAALGSAYQARRTTLRDLIDAYRAAGQ